MRTTSREKTWSSTWPRRNAGMGQKRLPCRPSPRVALEPHATPHPALGSSFWFPNTNTARTTTQTHRHNTHTHTAHPVLRVASFGFFSNRSSQPHKGNLSHKKRRAHSHGRRARRASKALRSCGGLLRAPCKRIWSPKGRESDLWRCFLGVPAGRAEVGRGRKRLAVWMFFGLQC